MLARKLVEKRRGGGGGELPCMPREKNVRIVSPGRTRCPRFASGVGRCSSLGEEGTNFMLTVNNIHILDPSVSVCFV